MARQGEIREGEIPPFEDDAPRQDAPHIPEGSQQDRPAEEEGSQYHPREREVRDYMGRQPGA